MLKSLPFTEAMKQGFKMNKNPTQMTEEIKFGNLDIFSMHIFLFLSLKYITLHRTYFIDKFSSETIWAIILSFARIYSSNVIGC